MACRAPPLRKGSKYRSCIGSSERMYLALLEISRDQGRRSFGEQRVKSCSFVVLQDPRRSWISSPEAAPGAAKAAPYRDMVSMHRPRSRRTTSHPFPFSVLGRDAGCMRIRQYDVGSTTPKADHMAFVDIQCHLDGVYRSRNGLLCPISLAFWGVTKMEEAGLTTGVRGLCTK